MVPVFYEMHIKDMRKGSAHGIDCIVDSGIASFSSVIKAKYNGKCSIAMAGSDPLAI
jgi:hypothetical protein